MDGESLRPRLQTIVEQTLADRDAGLELQSLMGQLSVSRDQLTKAVLEYTFGPDNQGFETITNEIYAKKVMPLVLHLHNVVKGSYHQERQRIVTSYLSAHLPASIVDIGFGVPQGYVFDCVVPNNISLTLADKDPASFDFARVLLDYRAIGWDRITFKQLDMDLGAYPGNYDSYLLLDSVEHTIDPTGYLTKTVEAAPREAQFVLAMPICPIDSVKGFHNIAWLNEKEADDWLNLCGLRVAQRKTININPDVDLFALGIIGGFRNYLVDCRKNI